VHWKISTYFDGGPMEGLACTDTGTSKASLFNGYCQANIMTPKLLPTSTPPNRICSPQCNETERKCSKLEGLDNHVPETERLMNQTHKFCPKCMERNTVRLTVLQFNRYSFGIIASSP
jgi:hypothetical protein